MTFRYVQIYLFCAKACLLLGLPQVSSVPLPFHCLTLFCVSSHWILYFQEDVKSKRPPQVCCPISHALNATVVPQIPSVVLPIPTVRRWDN